MIFFGEEMKNKPRWMEEGQVGASDRYPTYPAILGPYQLHLPKLFLDLPCHPKAKAEITGHTMCYGKMPIGDIH